MNGASTCKHYTRMIPWILWEKCVWTSLRWEYLRTRMYFYPKLKYFVFQYDSNSNSERSTTNLAWRCLLSNCCSTAVCITAIGHTNFRVRIYSTIVLVIVLSCTTTTAVLHIYSMRVCLKLLCLAQVRIAISDTCTGTPVALGSYCYCCLLHQVYSSIKYCTILYIRYANGYELVPGNRAERQNFNCNQK